MVNAGSKVVDEIDLLDIVIKLLGRWKLLLLCMLAGGALAFTLGRLIPKTYESSATIFIQQNSIGQGMLAEMPMIGSLGKDNTSYFAALLQSELMRRSVISDLNLTSNPHFARKKAVSEDDLVELFKKNVAIEPAKSGEIRVSVQAKDPQLAADIANKMLQNLSKFVVTNSQRKASFISTQIDSTTEDLQKAEEELLAFQENHQIAELNEETRGLVKQLTDLDGQIVDLNMQLESVNSELNNAGNLSSLADMEVRRRSLESSKKYLNTKREQLESKLSQFPVDAMQYSRLERKVKMLAKTYELLAEQYQLATIMQHGEGGEYQVIDQARPKQKPIAPRVKLIALAGCLLGLFVSALAVTPSAMRPQKRSKRTAKAHEE